jgi:hypothetical protein
MQAHRETITRELLSWAGVTSAPHRFGGTEFRLGRIELGHIHGDRLVDLPFPTAIRDKLIEQGEAEPHHVLPHTGWVSRRINSADDVDAAVRLFRLNYDRIVSRRKSADSM